MKRIALVSLLSAAGCLAPVAYEWQGFHCESDADCGGGTRCVAERCALPEEPQPDIGEVAPDAGRPSGDAADGSADAAGPLADAGTPLADAGDASADAGNTSSDAGDASIDGGDPSADAGDPSTDAGESSADAGDASTDAGDASGDAGTPSPACQTYVAPTGSDSAAGTLEAPWQTIAYGFSRLAAGGVLCIRGGTYYETPSLSANGTAGAPITVQAFPGERVVIDPGPRQFRTPGNDDWELVDAALGEYRSRTSAGSGRIWGYVDVPGYANERVLLLPYITAAAFRSTSDSYVDGTTPFYAGPGTFLDSDSRIHIRLAKTADLRAFESRTSPIFPSELPDPRDSSIVLTQAPSTLTLNGSYLVVRGLEINPALTSIVIGANAHDLRLEALKIWAGYYAIAANGPNIHHITVTRSRIYGDNPQWIFWSDRLLAPRVAEKISGSLVYLAGGTHHWEISWSHLRGAPEDLVSTHTSETEVSIHHNRLEDATTGLELEGTGSVGHIEVFENFIANCRTALSPGEGTPAFTGPLFVYRNVMALLRAPAINRVPNLSTWNGGGRYGHESMFGRSGTGYSVHYYHNTLVLLGTPKQGVNLVPVVPEDVRIANNLLVTVNGPVNRDYPAATGRVIDANLYWKVNSLDTSPLLSTYDTVATFAAATGLETHGVGSITRRGTDPLFVTPLEVVNRSAAVWELTAASERLGPADFRLQSSSPAIGAGIAIPDHPVYGRLPDTRASRDLGALPLGTPASEFDRFPFRP